jgi:radical SAM superfamily enzyme
MYEFFEVSFAEGLANGLSIEDTIKQGKEIYCSAITSDEQEQPRLQDVKQKFVAALQNMGIRGDRACVGARASILRDEVTEALTTLCNRDTPIGVDTPLQDDWIHETTEEIDNNH